jgi:hypothetical protein
MPVPHSLPHSCLYHTPACTTLFTTLMPVPHSLPHSCLYHTHACVRTPRPPGFFSTLNDKLPNPPHLPLNPVLAQTSRPPPGQRGCGCGWIARGIEWDGGSSWSCKLAASNCWCMVVYALQKVSSAAKLHQRGLRRS